MSAPFNPYQLTPSASLNRMQIVDLPGIDLEPDVRGKTAYELLSLPVLADQILCHAGTLGLAEETGHRAQLPRAFDRCFRAENPRVRDVAEAIAQRYGRRFGYLVTLLKRGDPVNRRARADVDDSYWEHWSRIQQIWLGGGLVSGNFGQRVRHHAQAVLLEAGVSDCTLHLADYPAVLPLIGAARSAAPGSHGTLVFDFGQSYIKRTYAVYEAGTLVGLRLLPPLPLDWTTLQHDSLMPQDQARRLADHMCEALVGTWQTASTRHLAPAPLLVASIASYIRDNQPLMRQDGPYAQFCFLADNLGHLLTQEVSRGLEQPVEVSLIHDGTAAARRYAGAQRGAVIMLGTALGVGFPPPAAHLRPVAPHFTVQPLEN